MNRNTRSVLTRGFCSTCLLFTLLASNAHARNTAEKNEPGLAGNIKLMVGVTHSTPALGAVSDENKTIENFTQDADSETTLFPIALWKLAYTFGNRRTALYAGTPDTNIVKGTYIMEVGARHQVDNGTTVSLSWIPDIPLLDNEVWKDPFLTGSDREETERDAQAFRLKAETIYGTPFYASFAIGYTDIEEEESGQSLTSDPVDLDALRRSSDAYQLETGIRMPLNRALIAGAALTYLRNEADGEANCFDDVGGKVALVFRHPDFQAFTNLSADLGTYDASHPVFDETREDRGYSASMGMEVPFDWNTLRLSFSLIMRYSRTDSSINFYDSESTMVGVGTTCRF